jgi:hypothetical protein
MAGHEEFHAFHDYMLPDIASASSNQPPSLFMFVWSPLKLNLDSNKRRIQKTTEDFQMSFRYWLKFLASKSRGALKVIVVLTHADQLEFIKAAVYTELKSLRDEFKGIIDILIDNTFEVDARLVESVQGVRIFIFEIAREMLKHAQIDV